MATENSSYPCRRTRANGGCCARRLPVQHPPFALVRRHGYDEFSVAMRAGDVGRRSVSVERDPVPVGEWLQEQCGIARYEHRAVTVDDLEVGAAGQVFAAEELGQPLEAEEGLEDADGPLLMRRPDRDVEFECRAGPRRIGLRFALI